MRTAHTKILRVLKHLKKTYFKISKYKDMLFSKKLFEVEVFLHYKPVQISSISVRWKAFFEPVMLLCGFCDSKSDLQDFASKTLRRSLHGHILQKKCHFCITHPQNTLKSPKTVFWLKRPYIVDLVYFKGGLCKNDIFFARYGHAGTCNGFWTQNPAGRI